MRITIYNLSKGKLSDTEVSAAVAAINRQIAEDVAPLWGMSATLRLEAPPAGATRGPAPSRLRGDAVLYLYDQVDVKGALGYHAANHEGVPYGFVFAELIAKLGENWSTTLSHEALELLGDPEVNLLTVGPNPNARTAPALFPYELCDPVQGDEYAIDGVRVSNFVTPLYFTTNEEKGSRNDFLGRGVASFGVRPKGYTQFIELPSLKVERVFGDGLARQRWDAVSEALGESRRLERHLMLRGGRAI